MFKVKTALFLFLVSVSSSAFSAANGWSYPLTPGTISPASGQSYTAETVHRYGFSVFNWLGKTTCSITASSSLTSYPWAATPVNTSVTIGFFGSKDIEVDVKVGLGTSTITVTTSGCNGGGNYTFTVIGTAPPNSVKITGLPSTYSGNFQTLGGTANSTISTPNQTACVYTSASNSYYYVRIEGLNDSGGSYYMAKGTDKFPVTITWNGTQLTPGSDKLFTTGSNSLSCNGSTNAIMVIKANSADVLKVPGSATQYTDSFKATVTHPNEI